MNRQLSLRVGLATGAAVIVTTVALVVACVPGTSPGEAGTEGLTPGPATSAEQESGIRGKPGHGGGREDPKPTRKPTKSPGTKTSSRPAPPAPPKAPPRKPGRFGASAMTDTSGWTYNTDPAGEVFAVVFSDFQTKDGDPSRRVRIVIPMTGDTRESKANLFFSGYVVTSSTATARLTVVAGSQRMTRTFRVSTDDEFTELFTVKLRSKSAVDITVKIDLYVDADDADSQGYINVLAIDGNLGI